MVIVREILATKKAPDVHTITPDSSVFDATAVLASRDLGVLVVAEHDRLVGMMTERDYVRKIVPKDLASREIRVRDIMSNRVPFVTPETKIDECMALMTNLRIRHLPVLSGSHLVGILSMGDVVKAVLGEKDFTIEELVRYITDSSMVIQAQRHNEDREYFGKSAET